VTIAAKHLDPLVGLDTHIILIPTPAGPVPTPLPHPYVGILFDPFDYAPFVGASTYINGLPRGVAGTNGKAMPPHIPMGGPFAKPPTNESEIFMGSATVLTDGDPQSFLGLPVLSCQDIGMPAPPRPKKKSVAKTLLLPTTVILCIPMGMLVLIGGPPTVSMMAIAQKLGLGALKKFKKGKLMRKLSDKLHKLANKLCDKLKIGKRARALVHKAICTVTGHPVDVATGKVFTDAVDFELSGPIDFEWERTWYSTSTYAGPLGHGWHHSYDQVLYFDDGIVLYQTGDGRHVGFPPLIPGQEHYDRANKLTLLRDATGYAVRDAEGFFYRFVAVAGRPRTEQPLVEIRDSVGHTLRFHYDARGKLSQILDSADRLLELHSDPAGRIVALTAPHPDQPDQRVYVARYEYDGWGNLVTVYDALGQTTTFAYHHHLLAKETDRRGFSFYFSYDAGDENARCVRTWGDGGLYDHKLTYDSDSGTTLVENSLGARTLHTHRGGLVIKTVNALGAVDLFEYNEYGEILVETDPLGQKTSLAYDDRGQITQITAPDGSQLGSEYDDNGEQTLLRDELGGSWELKRDPAGRVIETTSPLGARNQYHYGGRVLTGMTDALGGYGGMSYDASENLVELFAPDGTSTRFAYDGWGRVVAVTDENGNVERVRYDLLGRIEQRDEPDGNTRVFRYDPEGNLVQARDRNQDTTYTHFGTGRLASCTRQGTTVLFQYDTEEQLLAVANEHGSVFRFELDALGRTVTESGFDGLMRRYTYDAADRATRVDRPDQRHTEYVYDAAGQVLAAKHSDGTQETWRYRPDGDVVQIALDDVVVQFTLDAVGQVKKESRDKYWVESDYDLLGRRTKVRSSLGADQVVERDLAGDAAGVSELKSKYAARFTRDALGNELERQLPGGVRSRWQRDKLGRPVQHTVEAGKTPLRAASYQWDIDGRLRRVVDAFRGASEYGHDPLGNLAWARYPDGTVELRMPDAVANLFRASSRADRTYGPAGQLLTASTTRGTVHYAYDVEGNLIEKREPSGRVWRYEWNGAGYMTKVVRPDGSEVTFAYDGLGRRVRKTYRGQTTHWVWDGNVPLHEWVEGKLEPLTPPATPPAWSFDAEIKKRDAELQNHLGRGPPERGSPSEPITWLFEPESFAPMARLSAAGALSILTDDIGAPLLMVDEAGTRVWSANLDTYGELRDLEGDRLACPFRWPGQYEDAETGLYYNRARYYDPEAGTYISQDPSDLSAGLRLYAYVNDPTTWVDPLGLDLTNKEMGNAAERAAKRSLREGPPKRSVIGSIENKSGHGIDVVTKTKGRPPVIEVHEVKANTSRLNKHQKQGAAANAKRQLDRIDRNKFRHKGAASKRAAAALQKARDAGQKITGTIIRCKVDPKTGKVKVGKPKPWKKCK
jgi:RHS repeat-associated protein